jgi:hypothetical protein
VGARDHQDGALGVPHGQQMERPARAGDAHLPQSAQARPMRGQRPCGRDQFGHTGVSQLRQETHPRLVSPGFAIAVLHGLCELSRRPRGRLPGAPRRIYRQPVGALVASRGPGFSRRFHGRPGTLPVTFPSGTRAYPRTGQTDAAVRHRTPTARHAPRGRTRVRAGGRDGPTACGRSAYAVGPRDACFTRTAV